MKRRDFLAAVPLSALAAQTALSTVSTVAAEEQISQNEESPVDSYPLLQNPDSNGMTVVWAVRSSATGYAEYGETMKLGKKTITDCFGLNPYDDRFLQTRLTGLKPAATYYYRTVTIPVDYVTAYKIIPGKPVYSKIYRFRTPDANGGTASFSMMNDTHQTAVTLEKLTAKLAELQADYTFWNGDLMNDYHSDTQVVENIARPGNMPFAAEKPLLFVRGNHDYRGAWAKNIPRILTPWLHADLKYRNLAYNFAFRQGPVAFLSLDTGEDKPDAHPVFSGMIQCEPNHVLQTEWLAETLKRPEIVSAPYLIAFCHIPLHNPNPKANPGTTLEGSAAYSGNGLNNWGPLLHNAGVQAVVSAHQHVYRHSPAEEGRGWAQIVGGGPQLKNATLIHGKADKEKLTVTAYNMETNSVIETIDFKPRT